jgi:zinc protease
VRDALYAIGASRFVRADRDWTSLRVTCHRDHASICVELFADALTAPRFEDAEVARLRDEALYEVTDGILADEEALAREVLDGWIYEGHPYGHPIAGRAGVLPLLGSAQARAFHQRNYVRESITVGAAGAVSAEALDSLHQRLEALPGRLAPDRALQQPVRVDGRSLIAVDTDTPVAGFAFGHPWPIDRAHPDWPALYLALVAFGEHRQSHGRLFRELRTLRGLNYGDYAYIEPFVQRGGEAMPEQGTLRRQPMFSVWLRPTSEQNGAFLLRAALAEFERFVADGLTPEEFARIRTYAIARLPLFATDPERRLAYALDAAASGQPDPLAFLADRLRGLSVDEVNAAVQRHLSPNHLRIVAVAGEARWLVDAIVEGKPTPIVYAPGITPDAAQGARDAELAGWPFGVAADAARVVPAEGIFR